MRVHVARRMLTLRGFNTQSVQLWLGSAYGTTCMAGKNVCHAVFHIYGVHMVYICIWPGSCAVCTQHIARRVWNPRMRGGDGVLSRSLGLLTRPRQPAHHWAEPAQSDSLRSGAPICFTPHHGHHHPPVCCPGLGAGTAPPDQVMTQRVAHTSYARLPTMAATRKSWVW